MQNKNKKPYKNKPQSLGYHHIQKADKLRLHSLFRESIKHYLECILIERNNKRAYLGLAMAYKHLKDYDKAVETLKKAIKIDPKDAKLYYEAGICQLLTGCACKAVGYFQQSIKLDGKNLNAQIQLAIAHEMMDEAEIALMIYHKIIEKNPSYIVAYKHLAALYMNFESYKDASGVFRQILSINPKFYQAYLAIGACFDKLEMPKRALRYYRKYLELKPKAIDAIYIRQKIRKLKFKNTDETRILKVF